MKTFYRPGLILAGSLLRIRAGVARTEKSYGEFLMVVTTEGSFRLWITRCGSSIHANNRPQKRLPPQILRCPGGTRLSQHEKRLNPCSFLHSITYRYSSFHYSIEGRDIRISEIPASSSLVADHIEAITHEFFP